MITIGLLPDESVEPGHQVLVLPKDTEGIALATLLTGGVAIQSETEIFVAHTAEVDARIVDLINALAHVRFSAPQLVQMTLEESLS